MILAATVLATAGAAWAQQPLLDAGARAGNSYVPSVHTPGCGGLMCDSNDPRRVAGVAPPRCEGLLCSLSPSPYGMAPPVTAAEAKRMEDERASAAAAAASPAPATKSHREHRRAKAKAKKVQSVADRTSDPASTDKVR